VPVSNRPMRLILGSRRGAFAQVPPGDLDVAVFCQLTPAQLAFGNPFIARALEMIGFKAALGSWALVRESVISGSLASA
jgi:hypothetical protein